MLEGLDEIDWSRLRHANGPATDAPERIRALASGDPEARRAALDWLGISPPALATALVPFLVELLQMPVFSERKRVLEYLGRLAIYGGAPAASADARAALAAVRERMSNCAELLEDDDPHVRYEVTELLAAARQTNEEAAARVLARLDRESDPNVRFALLLCLSSVGTAALLPYLVDELLLAGPDPAARWSAARAVVDLCGPESPPEAIAVLESALTRPDFRSDVNALLGWDVLNLVAVTIDGLDGVGREVAGPILRRALASLPSEECERVLDRFLADTGFEPWAPPTRETLTPDQHDLLEYLVGLPNLAWEAPGFSRVLRDFGLPTTREEIELLVGPPAPKLKRKRK